MKNFIEKHINFLRELYQYSYNIDRPFRKQEYIDSLLKQCSDIAIVICDGCFVEEIRECEQSIIDYIKNGEAHHRTKFGFVTLSTARELVDHFSPTFDPLP